MVDETDGVGETFDDSMRVALTVASQFGERISRLREQLARQREADARQETRELESRFESERGAMRASLEPVKHAEWWDRANVESIAEVHHTATAWRDHDDVARDAQETTAAKSVSGTVLTSTAPALTRLPWPRRFATPKKIAPGPPRNAGVRGSSSPRVTSSLRARRRESATPTRRLSGHGRQTTSRSASRSSVRRLSPPAMPAPTARTVNLPTTAQSADARSPATLRGRPTPRPSTRESSRTGRTPSTHERPS